MGAAEVGEQESGCWDSRGSGCHIRSEQAFLEALSPWWPYPESLLLHRQTMGKVLFSALETH